MFVAACLLLILAGCGPKPVTPEGIIPPPEMKLIMYDMMRAGEFLSGYVIYKDSVKNKIGESMKWYDKVWETHHVSEAAFRKSYQWYQDNPEMMQALMDSIIVIPTPAAPLPDTSSMKKDSVLKVDSLRKRKLQATRALIDSARRRGRP